MGGWRNGVEGEEVSSLRRAAILAALCVVLVVQLVGCAARGPTRPIVAPRFYGTWANANPRRSNWMVVSDQGAVFYEWGANGKCVPHQPITFSPNEIRFPDTTVQVRSAEDLLLAVSDDWQTVAMYKRIDASAICRGSHDTRTEATATTSARPVLASRFYGIWANANPRRPDWMLIGDAGVDSYSITTDGRCVTYHAITLAPNEFQAQAAIYIWRAEELLLMVSDDWQVAAIWKQADAKAVCRKTDGSYAEGAPKIGRSP
jgi:hypothetical protein